MRRGAPPGERWLQPADRSLESALKQRISGGGGGGGCGGGCGGCGGSFNGGSFNGGSFNGGSFNGGSTSASASVQEAGEALMRAEAAEALVAAAQAAAVDLRLPRPTVSTVSRGRFRTLPRTLHRTLHRTTQRDSARTTSITPHPTAPPTPHPCLAPCTHTLPLEPTGSALAQVWAEEIPRLEAEKRAAKQACCRTQ